MDIDTIDVLEAAGSKWNFCLSDQDYGRSLYRADPHYLTHKAELDIILKLCWLAVELMMVWASGYRKISPEFSKTRIELVNARVLILGLSFKENCPDLRNTKVVDLVAGLQRFGMHVDVVDPWINKLDAQSMYNIETTLSILNALNTVQLSWL